MQPMWILVADRARARILESGEKNSISEVASFINPDSRGRGRTTAVERLPRVNESFGGARHAIEPHTTLLDKTTARFARLLGDALQRGYDENRYGQLVLIAPPRFLGELHRALHEKLRAHVVKEIRHGLTTLPTDALRERLRADSVKF